MAPRRLPTMPDAAAEPLPSAVTASVGFLVREVTAYFRMGFERVLVSHRLRPTQYLMLVVLRDEGPRSQQQLGQRLGMDRTSTMQQVQALADAGLLDRHDDPSDKRVYRVSLTPAGRQLTGALEAQIRQEELALLAPLTPDERTTFAAQLRRIVGSRNERAADGV